jgi:ribosomal protein L11 methyltransferase
MKTSPPLCRISVLTTAEAEDAVCELLTSITGHAAVAYYHLDSQASRVSVFAEAGEFPGPRTRREIAAGLARIKSFGLPIGAAKIQLVRVKREDWAESWKRHFHPLEIKPGPGQARSGLRSLLVKPSWSRRRPAARQAVIILDPGLSFGTGQHPTTSFCLQQIVRHQAPAAPRSFLDIGTGSGILAIAAAKLGYAPVQAFDFDPESVRVAGDNARKNRVADRLRLTRQDITRLPLRSRMKFDLICANLISTLLIAERRRIVNRLKPGGTLVLAGILAAEFTEVQRAFADVKLKLLASRTENEWRSGAFCWA